MKELADLVEQMLRDGVSHEIIVGTIRMRDASVTRHVTNEGGGANKSAERSKRYRDRKRAERDERRDASRDDRDGKESFPHTPFKENIPPETLRVSSPKPKSASRAMRLTPEWAPLDADRAFAKDLGASDEWINDQADRFRDYWTAKAGAAAAKTSWSATWRNWVRRSLERGDKPTPKRVGGLAIAVTDEQWRLRFQTYKTTGQWITERWGDSPETGRCTAPAHILREFQPERQQA